MTDKQTTEQENELLALRWAVNHVFQTIGVPLLRVTPKDRINIPDFLRKEEE